MSKRKILVQLDSDPQASVFDAVVAVDSEVDQLLQYHSIEPSDVQDLVHGAMFTRGPQDLKSTAIFVGGSDVTAGEALLSQVTKCFFGPMRVSVMLDANGANTTAAAAVLAAANHVELPGATATILAGTGPVGQRAARMLVGNGATVRVASRNLERSTAVCDAIRTRIPAASLIPTQARSSEEVRAAIEGAHIVIAAGAAGVELLSRALRQQAGSIKVAIDLNAVPPLGIEGIDVMDKAKNVDGVACYGAIGVGGMKMKIHKAAIKRLFESNDQVLDAEQIFAIGKQLQS